MAKATKAPTGLTIARSGGTYTASWKCGDKNYSSGQQFQYSINGGRWAGLSVAASVRSKAVSFNMENYYPTKNVYFSTFSVRVRGKKKGGKWSAWATKTYTNYVPNVPNLEASLDEQQTNKCTFTWNLTTEATDARPYYHVRWETILVKESDVTDGSKLTWDSSALGWSTGAGSYASSVTMTEDTTLLADASYTRWFRVCGRGARGSSAWRYEKHVYARPYQAKIEEAEVIRTDAEGLTCYARWKADQTASHPIDYTTVQYLITVPNAGLTCPSGAQWSDANISADTNDTDAVRFSIDDVLDKDECLFVRVNTVHDTNVTYSEPKLASVGDLKDPTDLSYQVDNANHTLTSVSVDNNSSVPDSFIAIVYRAGSNPEDELVVGIIPHEASQPLVTPVQCPDWSGESAFSIGAYAAVGTYEANSIGYTVKAEMRSASTIWVGGAVPVAPENVNVVQSPITGTATVTWDWTWEEARFAQLSWTDHDDAWESTDEPEIYSITKPKATKWNISGLELGKKWYIAVRLVSGNPDDENAIYSPWSDMRDIILSSVPNVPSLNLSTRVITEGEEITASWDFVSNDGTGQISAEIKDEDGNLIAHTETQKEVVIDTEALGWSQGETHSLSVRVTSESNRTTEWSNPVSIVVAEALEGSISETSLETKTIEVNPRSFEKTDFLSFLTEQEEVFTKLQVDLDPIQDLHGYDKPWVACSHYNKWDEEWELGSLDSDGTEIPSNNTIRAKNYININPSTEYYFYCGKAGAGIAVFWYDENKTITGTRIFVESGANNALTSPADAKYCRFRGFDPEYGTTYLNDISVNYPSSIRTYYPTANICPISGWDSVGVIDDPTYGGFVQWNQLAHNGNFAEVGNWIAAKGTISINNNICTLSPTYQSGENSYVRQNQTDVTKYVGHKFLTSVDVKSSSWATSGSRVVISVGGQWAVNANYALATNEWITLRGIHEALTAGYLAIEIRKYYESSLAVMEVRNVNVYDLTAMFGAGNEPSTIDEFKAIFPNDYYAYNAGTKTNASAVNGTPYISHTTTLPSTTYGGTLDLVSGVLTVTHKIVDFGNLNWDYSSANTRFSAVISDKKPYSSATDYAQLICSVYPFDGAAGIGGTMFDKTIVNRASASNNQVLVKDTSYTDATTFKTAMTGQTICYELATPTTTTLTPQQIQTLVGQNNVWSENGEITARIAETHKDVLSLTQMPLTVKLAGVNDNIISTLTIERTADYHMDRPDETQFDGFEGEIVYLTTQNGGEDIIINQEDLIGLMDDEAPYRVFVTFKDVYGQSMSDSVDFEVHWDHQAIIPEALVEIDEENLIAKLTPIAPTGTLTGDTCDIYRLSADRPELIVKDAVFGTQYVDPYPAIGEFGGHRFVFKTVNGDYITATNDIAWTDTGIEEGDILESKRAIIDFDGNQLLLYYNVDVGHQWDKDFQQTKYLGGSVQGDWNAGVSRSGSVSATMITLTDSEQIGLMRDLAVYTGACHVRTTDGSSYTADVQVSEDRDHDDYGKLASFSLTITRVDAETLDGLTYQQWAEEEE